MQPIIDIIEKVDRMIDIWNNTGISNRNEFKGCEMINSPDHFHIEELFKILDIFCEWKRDCGENTKEFIPWQSMEDLVFLVAGIVGVAKVYLKEDESRTMVQRQGGTDCCENEFAGVRERNPKPTILNAKQSFARRAGTRTSVFNLRNKSNTSGDKRIHYDELMSPISKKSKRK